MNMSAQLVVDSLGKVGIGTERPQSLLQVNKASGSELGDKRAIKVYSNNSFGRNIGIESRAVSSSNFTCAIQGGVDSTFAAYGAGVMGYASWGNTAAIFGSTLPNDSTFAYSGTYAGYFRGNLRVTGSTYSNAYLTASGSIYNPGRSITPIAEMPSSQSSGTYERVSDKLGRVQAVQFLRYNPDRGQNDAEINRADSQTEEIEDIREEEKLSPIQYGLDPAQLKEVYPELVYEDADGNISINYVEMVPLLVQSINELSQELAELKGTSAKRAKSKSKSTTIEETASEVDMVRMDQNKPNPFSESTVITLNVPEKTQKANIFIYDMSGKQVKSILVSERGETNITVYASDLSAGMYIYTLVVDGKVKVTRRMIVSEV